MLKKDLNPQPSVLFTLISQEPSLAFFVPFLFEILVTASPYLVLGMAVPLLSALYVLTYFILTDSL